MKYEQLPEEGHTINIGWMKKKKSLKWGFFVGVLYLLDRIVTGKVFNGDNETGLDIILALTSILSPMLLVFLFYWPRTKSDNKPKIVRSKKIKVLFKSIIGLLLLIGIGSRIAVIVMKKSIEENIGKIEEREGRSIDQMLNELDEHRIEEELKTIRLSAEPYINTSAGFSIHFPAGWDVDETVEEIVVQAVNTTSGISIFVHMHTINNREYLETLNPEELFNFVFPESWKLIEANVRVIDNKIATRFKKKYEDEIDTFYSFDYVILDEKFLYLISGMSNDSNLTLLEKYEELLTSSIETFRLNH